MNTTEIAEKVVHQARETTARQKDLVDQVADAQLSLEVALSGFRKEWLDWTSESKTILNDFRLWRMAMSTEADKCMTQFGDVRKFFLSEDHLKEVERLKEFIGLMERLKALKDSGFLDRVTDTMLKIG